MSSQHDNISYINNIIGPMSHTNNSMRKKTATDIHKFANLAYGEDICFHNVYHCGIYDSNYKGTVYKSILFFTNYGRVLCIKKELRNWDMKWYLKTIDYYDLHFHISDKTLNILFRFHNLGSDINDIVMNIIWDEAAEQGIIKA